MFLMKLEIFYLLLKVKKEAINDFSPVLDTIIWNNKQVYQRQYFDLIEDQWMKNGLVFKNILTDDALIKMF